MQPTPKLSEEQWIGGIDEAGRGPLAGPVVAAVVILNPSRRIRGLKDSKLLLPEQREKLFISIQEKAIAWAVGSASHEEIDQINIFQATLLAMQRAVAHLPVRPYKVLVDGKHAPQFDCQVETIVNGDETEPVISAASIVAKVLRDREMVLLHQQYPQYGFAKHKGYSTREHIAALKKHGPCFIHRRSFAPVANAL